MKMLGGYPLTKQFFSKKSLTVAKKFSSTVFEKPPNSHVGNLEKDFLTENLKKYKFCVENFCDFFSTICVSCIVPKNSNVVIYACKTLFLLKIRRRPRCWKNFEKNRIVPKKPKGLPFTFACIKRFRFRLLRQEKIRVNLSAR